MRVNNRKQQILDYIARCLDEEGYSPTYREIAAAVGFHSTSSVARCIGQLKQEGYLLKQETVKCRTAITSRRVLAPISEAGVSRRVKLTTANGGCVQFDCAIQRHGESEVSVSFMGIIDVSEMTAATGRIVKCTPVREAIF